MHKIVTVIDIAIIYLACGAPFGVYHAFLADRTLSRVVLAVAAWPVFAIRLAASTRQSSTNIHALLVATRKSIEADLFVASTPEAVFDFREVFDRYTGLALAAQESAGLALAGLHEMTGHPSKSLAESCMLRTHKARLRRHVIAARSEFVALLAPNRSDSLNSAIKTLGEVLADPALCPGLDEAVIVPDSRRIAARVG